MFCATSSAARTTAATRGRVVTISVVAFEARSASSECALPPTYASVLGTLLRRDWPRWPLQRVPR
eukprot:11154230-Lingulodinium_polyedra.AAC.1